MAPYFGPLSANEPTLRGLSKREALKAIRSQIRQGIKQIAPPKPDSWPRHNPRHKETGPWLSLGTGPGDQRNAGRWYRICTTCDPAIVQFLTPAFTEQCIEDYAPSNLFCMYYEVQVAYEDEPEDDLVSITATNGEDS